MLSIINTCFVAENYFLKLLDKSQENLLFPGAMSGQHYCLRWNNYQSNMTSVFHQLLQNEAFVDVTLACNDLSLKAHKVKLLCFVKNENVFKTKFL